MVQSTSWFRRVVLRQVGVSLGATSAVAGLGAALVVAAAGRESVEVAAGGAIAATLVAGVRLVVALAFQPTGVRYQRRHAAHVPDLAAAEPDLDTGIDLDPQEVPTAVADAVATLEALGFDHVATVVDRASGSVPVLRVLAARDGLVVASVALPSGSVTVHSGLVDDHAGPAPSTPTSVLVTTASLIVPSAGLVVDLVPGADVTTLVSRHARLLKLMFERRLCAGDPVQVVCAALQMERRGLIGLGSVAGALVRVDETRHRFSVSGAPSADALLVHTSLASLSTTGPLATEQPANTALSLNQTSTAPIPQRVVQPLLLWEAPPSVSANGEPRRLQPTVV